MKGFLIDENLPRRLTFTPSLPITLSDVLGESPSDTALWQYARTQSLAVVTKDADFSYRIMASTPPPWIVHFRFGNLRRKEFHAVLGRMWPHVEAHKLLCVYADRIEAFRD